MCISALTVEGQKARHVLTQKLNTNTLMKMEIRKHGKMIKEVECPECHCVFTYNKNKDVYTMFRTGKIPNAFDMTSEYERVDYRYVGCPECNAQVTVEEDGD